MSPLITGLPGGPVVAATQVAFVDQIASSPAVLLDLNDLAPYMCETIDLSPPQLHRATTSTMLVDGERITAESYGNRSIGITLELATAVAYDNTAAAAALSVLAQQLDRESNILMVTLGDVQTFYRTYRAPDFALEMLNHNVDYSKVTLQVPAEPFGYGLLQSVPGQTIVADPAGGVGSTGRSISITGVLGDVETPAILASLDLGIASSKTTLIATRRRGIPHNLNTVVQAEGQFLGADTTVHASDPQFSGTGYLHTTFADPSLTGRVSTTWPPGPDAEARGTYKLFVRCRKTVAGDTVNMAAFIDFAFTGPAVTLANTTNLTLVYLGEFTFPRGHDPVTFGSSGVELPIIGSTVQILASRSGSGALDIDYLLWVPADDRTCYVDWDGSFVAGYSQYSVIDATTDMVYQLGAPAGTTGGISAPGWSVLPSAHVPRGGMPMLSPGENRLFLLPDVTPGALDDVTGTEGIDVFYWPRYLTLASA